MEKILHLFCSRWLKAAPNTTNVGEKYLVRYYKFADNDGSDGFYSFYNKTITRLTRATPYDRISVNHPLAGFVAGDILPESVWCLSFRPKCDPSGMVYDINTDMAVDIYLQSGVGRLTASEYNKVPTVSREWQNHNDDMMQIGKKLPDYHEWNSCAEGTVNGMVEGGAEGNEADPPYIGGNGLTGGNLAASIYGGGRLISFIGVEEAVVGYIYNGQNT